MKKQNRKAFTIVELVIVIAVIGILAAVLIPTFSGIIKSANIAADEAEAASLTTQLNMNLDGIKTQEDLYNTIVKTYGAEAAKTFAPRSAQYGYHYWYDAKTNRIELAKYSELADIEARTANISTGAVESGAALMSAVTIADAGFTPFEPAHFRSVKDGRFFLIDMGGSEVVDALAKLDTVGSGDDKFTDVLTTLAAITGDDQAIAANALAKLEKTAVVAYGTFVADANAVIENVYFSRTVTEIYATDVIINNDEKLTLTLPANITKLNSYGLAFKTESDLHINATESEAKDMLAANSAENCNIILNGVSGYSLDGTTLKGPNGNSVADLTVSASSIIADMTLKATTATDNKIELVPQTDGSYNLYVAVDYSGDITFDVIDFLDADGEKITARGEKWAEASDKITFENGKFKVTGYEDTIAASAGALTVTIQNLTKTINVYGVKVTNVTVSGYDNANLNIRYEDFDASNPTKFTKVITLPYIPNADDNKWNFVPAVETNYPGVNVMPAGNVDVTNLDGMVYSSGVLSIPAGYSDNNFMTANVEFKYDNEALGAVKSGITYKFNLINNSDPSFELAKVVSEVKNKLTDYVVGNDGAIALKYLFQNVEGKDISNQIVVLEVYGAGSTPIIRHTDINFNEYKLNLKDIEFDGLEQDDNGKYHIRICICLGEKESKDGEPTGKIINRGAVAELTVQFVTATNVTDENGKSITGSSSTNIVLLSDIDFSENKTTTRKFNNVYGNLHKITATGFNSSSAPSYMSEVIDLYGTMDNTIVAGPVYKTINVNGSGAYGWDGICLVSSSSKITNSYISGFRAPVSVKTDIDVRIDNSVIEGGTYANMFIHRSKTVTLNNVYTIQARSGYAVTGDNNKRIIGLGIFCDTSNSGTVILKGNTTQYNWVCKEDLNNYDAAAFFELNLGFYKVSIGIKQVIEYMVDNGSNYRHSVAEGGSTIKFVNTGIIQENDKTTTTQLSATADNGYTGSLTYSTKQTVDAKVMGILVKTYNAYSVTSCGNTCSHQWLPADYDNNGEYGVDEYLHSRILTTN